ncbi:hypothetical protein [Winogradskyella sp.]|uniref:hypothetical protein n=1 Tax=Winogradskyella sp. TaxID=1883156 RepID=UPI00260F5B37|nr:hypothetical protein [Winogradskyella sp.]
MKPSIFIVLLSTCLLGKSQTAYRPFFDFKSVSAQEMNLKGNIARISLRIYNTDRVTGSISNGVIHYQFANNRLQSKRIERFNEVHFYNHKNEKLDSITVRVNGKFHSSKSFTHLGNQTEIRNTKNNQLLGTFTTNSKGQIIKLIEKIGFETITTRAFAEFEGITFIKQQQTIRYRTDGSERSREGITNTQKKGTWLGLPVIVQTSKQDYFATTTTSYYNTKGHLVFEEITGVKMMEPITTETFYKYDLRGNWVSAITYNKNTGMVKKYQERKITYTDNFVSGNIDFNESYIKSTKYPEFPNQYAYKYDVAKNLFWLKDPSGNYLTKNDWKYFGNKSTNHYYYFDKTNGALVELTNYKLVKEGDLNFRPAKVISKNYEDFIFNIDNINYIFTDGQFQNFSEGHIVKQSIDENQNSYYNTKTNKLYLFTSACEQNTCELQLMPYSKDKVHYYLYKDSSGNIDCSPFGNGKLLDIKDYKSIFGGTKSFMDYNGLYLEYDLTKTSFNTFYPAKVISKAKFDKVFAKSTNLQGNVYATAEGLAELINRYPESFAPKTPTKTTSAEQPQISPALTKTTTPNNRTINNKVDAYDCNNNLKCLSKLLQDRYNQLKGQGKTDKEAAKEQAEIINKVYDYNKELAYQMVMDIKNNQLLNVLSELSPEQRAYFRSKSMNTIKSYEKKHGKTKIKTVPYKPKN